MWQYCFYLQNLMSALVQDSPVTWFCGAVFSWFVETDIRFVTFKTFTILCLCRWLNAVVCFMPVRHLCMHSSSLCFIWCARCLSTKGSTWLLIWKTWKRYRIWQLSRKCQEIDKTLSVVVGRFERRDTSIPAIYTSWLMTGLVSRCWHS